MYRIYHKPRLGEPMGYIVQQKHWWQFNWLSIAWFKTYEEAKEFLEDYKYNHTKFPTKEWLYLWKRIKEQDTELEYLTNNKEKNDICNN